MSKEADYGLVLMTQFLRGEPGEDSLSARQLSGRTGLSLPMVSKVLKALTREGLLHSQRGASGGYLLSKDPEQISVAQIVSAVEGPIALTECLEDTGDCRRMLTCPVRTNWQKINVAILGVLESITLKDMVDTAEDHLVGLGIEIGSPPMASQPDPEELYATPSSAV